MIYLIAAAAAIVAACAELGTTYPRSPLTSVGLWGRWLWILALDGAAGALAILIWHSTSGPHEPAWLTGAVGAAVIGLVASLIVRANLFDVTVGKATVPVGFGVVYGSLRSLVERQLRNKVWELNYSEQSGRLEWSLARVDLLVPKGLTFVKVEKALRNYFDTVILPVVSDNKLKKQIDDGIDAAKLQVVAHEVDAIKQLVALMNEQNFVSPLHGLLGRPAKAQIKQWRS